MFILFDIVRLVVEKVRASLMLYAYVLIRVLFVDTTQKL